LSNLDQFHFPMTVPVHLVPLPGLLIHGRLTVDAPGTYGMAQLDPMNIDRYLLSAHGTLRAHVGPYRHETRIADPHTRNELTRRAGELARTCSGMGSAPGVGGFDAASFQREFRVLLDGYELAVSLNGGKPFESRTIPPEPVLDQAWFSPPLGEENLALGDAASQDVGL